MPGILHRTIFGELAKVFVLSLLGITGIIVMAAIVVEASQRGLGPIQILGVVPLLVPSMLPFIVPPTTLFASCVVYGRLSHDNEIIAIKSAGISVLHVIWPGVMLGAVMSAATLGLYYHLIPYTHHVLRTAIVKDVEEFLYLMLKRDGEIRSTPAMKLNYEMWVEQVQGRQLKNAIFKRRDEQGRYDVIAKAREAELTVDLNKREVIVHLHHVQVLNDDGKTRGHDAAREYPVPMPAIDNQKPSTRDMTWQELLSYRQEMATKEQQAATQIAPLSNLRMERALPPPSVKHLEYLESLLRRYQQEIRSTNAELQMRPALSFGCLFFVLVGCPVGIWFSRSDYLSAFITCFLPIVFLYYPVQLCSTNLAKDGKLHPLVALWAANAVMGIIAVGLFRKLLKN